MEGLRDQLGTHLYTSIPWLLFLKRIDFCFTVKIFLLSSTFRDVVNLLSSWELSELGSLLKSGTTKFHPPVYWVPLGVCDSVTLRPINPQLSQQPALGLGRHSNSHERHLRTDSTYIYFSIKFPLCVRNFIINITHHCHLPLFLGITRLS